MVDGLLLQVHEIPAPSASFSKGYEPSLSETLRGSLWRRLSNVQETPPKHSNRLFFDGSTFCFPRWYVRLLFFDTLL